MTRPEVPRRRHLVLVGLPGSGKSTVGSIVARTRGVPFFDVDREIERTVGRSVGQIFAEFGEDHFRDLESASVADLLRQRSPCVIAPGGGWAAQHGNLQVAGGSAVCIYLETSPTIAVARASHLGGRPVLPEGQELSAMQELLRNRERYYLAAGPRVGTDDLDATQAARQVLELALIKGAL